ncbi:small kinetochore-associated protein-like [Lacerta agilis]|uniref:small kinetochore-associated protein-like n=1 Tax=Lacerta agilis TaxID=80427 RepID=UPI00141A399E|nr:small kinetochore-associated protein-like [Lacerta agilis]XP_033001095.1 small kinetochore-associated protein-like [Lacerta agilis]
MQNEMSRIPIYSFQQPKVISMPTDPHSKEHCFVKPDLGPLKAPDFTFGENVPVRAALKDTNQRFMKKATQPPPKKAATSNARTPMSRYRREAELRNKNKQLESAKWEVSSKLMEAEKDLKNVKEQCDSLEKENQKLKKFQESCMLILAARNCDPATGDKILEEDEENQKTQAEIMDLMEKLTSDLELFTQMAKEQKENLQKTHIKWKQVEEEQAHFLEQEQCFHREMEDLFAILDQAEELVNSS